MQVMVVFIFDDLWSAYVHFFIDLSVFDKKMGAVMHFFFCDLLIKIFKKIKDIIETTAKYP